jgi:hypothetical protein
VGLAFAAALALLWWAARDRRPAVLALVWLAGALQPVLYFRAHIDPYYLAPSLAAVALLLAASLPARSLSRIPAWTHGALACAFILWASFVSVKLEGRWWNDRALISLRILEQMPGISRQIPEGRLALFFGFGEEELGAMQNDSALKAYGYSIDRFIIVGINQETPGQIRTLQASGSIRDYYGIAYSRGNLLNVTAAMHKDVGPFLDPPVLEVTPSEVRRGQGSLRLQLRGLRVPAMDVLYHLDGKPMPMVRWWPVEHDGSVKTPVDESTRPGLYDFRAIRDARDTDPTAWYPVNIQVRVQ